MNSVTFFRNSQANVPGAATAAPLLLDLQARLRKLGLNARLAEVILEARQRQCLDQILILTALCVQPRKLLPDICDLWCSTPQSFAIQLNRHDIIYNQLPGQHSDLLSDLLAWSDLTTARLGECLPQRCRDLGAAQEIFEDAHNLYRQLRQEIDQLNLHHRPHRKTCLVDIGEDIITCFLKVFPELLITWGVARRTLSGIYTDFTRDSLCYNGQPEMAGMALRWERFLDSGCRVVVQQAALLPKELLHEIHPQLKQVSESWHVSASCLPLCISQWQLGEKSFEVRNRPDCGSGQYRRAVATAAVNGRLKKLKYSPSICVELLELRRRAGADNLPFPYTQALIEWLAAGLLKVQRHDQLQAHLDANHPSLEVLALTTATSDLPERLQWARAHFPNAIGLAGKRYPVTYLGCAASKLKIAVDLASDYDLLDQLTLADFPISWHAAADVRLKLAVPGHASPHRPARGHSYSLKRLGLERIRELAAQRLARKREQAQLSSETTPDHNPIKEE